MCGTGAELYDALDELAAAREEREVLAGEKEAGSRRIHFQPHTYEAAGSSA